jgi:acetyl-CoA carboxylase carboxyltransferase component
MIGPDAERSGLLRRGSRAVNAIQRASVPVFTVQVRRSFGLAAQATGNRNGSSIRLAWPIGSWGDMPLGGGLMAEFRAEIEAAEDPEAKRAELLERFEAQGSMWPTVENFGVEEVIDPRETRRVLARFVELAATAAEPGPKHGPQVRP